MLKYFLTILAISLLLPTFSQTVSSKEILKDVREHYGGDYAFEADFIMEIDIPEATTTTMEGTLSLNGERFKFQMEDQTVISDNVNLWYWTSTPDINEVQISYIEDTEDIISPSDIFGDYLKGFLYKIIGETTSDGKELVLIELIPAKKDDKNPYFKVRVVVEPLTDQLHQLQVFYKDGTVYTFKIKNETQASFTNNFFSFDENSNPNTEVIDLR